MAQLSQLRAIKMSAQFVAFAGVASLNVNKAFAFMILLEQRARLATAQGLSFTVQKLRVHS